MINGAPGNRLDWSVQFFTSDGIEVRFSCQATIRPDRTFQPTPDNPRCVEDIGRVAWGFPLVVTELSDNVLELRISRLEFFSGWTFTDFALRVEATNPTQPFVTPRADFRLTL